MAFNGHAFTASDDGQWFVTTHEGQRIEGRLEFETSQRSLFWFNKVPRPYGLKDSIYVSPLDVEPSWRRPA